MATTSGNMNTLKVTGKDGNVFVMTPVDTEARQAIDEAKNLQFDDDYFTAEVSQDQSTVSVGLNGVPIGVTSPLRFDQDTAQGIVIGIDTSSVTPPEMTGATASADGASGLVPAPLTGDQGKFLKGDGTWDSLPVFAGTANGVVNAPASANRNHYSFLDGMGDWSMLEEVSESSINGMFLSVTIDGREYKVVQIGNQLWMAENLDYVFDYEGNPLPVGGSDITVTTPAAWYYNNDKTNYGIDGTYKCGLLYNWYAAKYLHDNRATLLPDGWHVPSSSEWATLLTTAGGMNYAGPKLRALNNSVTSNWPSNWNGTDDYGFNALPSGSYTGGFDQYFYGWNLYEMSSAQACYMRISSANTVEENFSPKYTGYSLRLVKDAT